MKALVFRAWPKEDENIHKQVYILESNSFKERMFVEKFERYNEALEEIEIPEEVKDEAALNDDD